MDMIYVWNTVYFRFQVPNAALGIRKYENPAIQINFINLFQCGDTVALTVSSIIERRINLRNALHRLN